MIIALLQRLSFSKPCVGQDWSRPPLCPALSFLDVHMLTVCHPSRMPDSATSGGFTDSRQGSTCGCANQFNAILHT